MIRFCAMICIALMAMPEAVSAQSRERIGYGRLITNDFFGDGRDRWRSGSFVSSRVWGYGWSGALPDRPGDILELRFGAEIVGPDNLIAPAPGDRRYGTALSLGLHTHFERGGTEIALGADLVMTGPQTRLSDLQAGFHDLLGMDKASSAVRAAQIGNGLHPTAVLEAGRVVDLGGAARLRPFVEARAGAETLRRAGADLTIGALGRDELMLREAVTGQRYRTMQGASVGYALVLGADVATVESSVFLPSGGGAELRDSRTRLRAGLHWQGAQTSLFYGLTWLGKEFEGQDEGQLVGSVRLNFNF